MSSVAPAPAPLSTGQRALLAQLIQAEQAKLLIEIRHTDHRSYRDELTRRLQVIEDLAKIFPETTAE